MLKKSEVIEALENGGYILLDDWSGRAHVYTVSDGHIGVCRWDTAEKIGTAEPYEKIEGYGYSKQPRILNPYAMAAEKAAAAHELTSIRTPGNIEIRAKNDCRIGGNYVAKGRRYIIRVYGDGTQEQPGHAYGSLYDFRTHEHAVYFEIVNRPTDVDAESASPEAAEATQETDPQEAQPVKVYHNENTGERTESATEALRWHRGGDSVRVDTLGAYWGETLRSVTITGAPQAAPRDENWEHCRRISDDIDAYVNGEYKRCPDCGEIHRRDWDDIADAFRCPNCGEIASVDDWDTLSIWEYLEDTLDIEYRCSSSKEYRSIQIMVAWGGPNIYLDTGSKAVELYWWGEKARYSLSSAAVEAIDEWAEEMWRCL